jgi:hypothetical protein
VAGLRRVDPALLAICAFVAVAGIWNTLRYPPGLGYDAIAHMAYASGLVPGGHLPPSTGPLATEYYTPPGYYALAGSADWIAHKLGASTYASFRAGMGLNALFLLATVVLVWCIARDLWPERRRIRIAATLFTALAPVAAKTASMFHPEPLALALATLALWLVVRAFRDARYAIPLGLALGAAQLVRASTLWTVAVVLLALAVGRRFRLLAIVLALAVVVPLPWYVHQEIRYGGDPVFPRPATTLARVGANPVAKPKPLWDRQPLRFYFDPGIPDVITKPYSPAFGSTSSGLAIPITYDELWGDYEGVWAWKANHLDAQPSSGAHAELTIQSVVGLLPTLIAVVGWLVLLRSSLRRPDRLAIALLPLVGLLGYVYFTTSYPTPGGDVLKATYMLTTLGGWAVGFAYGLDRLRGRWWTVTVALLAVCALADLPYLFYF